MLSSIDNKEDIINHGGMLEINLDIIWHSVIAYDLAKQTNKQGVGPCTITNYHTVS